MTDFTSRLKVFIEEKGLTIAAFEKACKLGNATISKAIKNKTALRTDVIEKILTRFPNLSVEWLFTGSDNSLKPDMYQNEHTDGLIDGIPLIPIDAMAGFFTGEVSVMEAECERLSIPGIKADFVIPISGDSMEPLYYSGDYVACQRIESMQSFFQYGKVYVVDTKQGVLLKKVKRSKSPNHILLVSENTEYDPIDLPLSDVYHIALVKALVRVV